MFFPNKLLHSTLGVQERYVEASGRSVEEEMDGLWTEKCPLKGHNRLPFEHQYLRGALNASILVGLNNMELTSKAMEVLQGCAMKKITPQ